MLEKILVPEPGFDVEVLWFDGQGPLDLELIRGMRFGEVERLQQRRNGKEEFLPRKRTPDAGSYSISEGLSKVSIAYVPKSLERARARRGGVLCHTFQLFGGSASKASPSILSGLNSSASAP